MAYQDHLPDWELGYPSEEDLQKLDNTAIAARPDLGSRLRARHTGGRSHTAGAAVVNYR